MHSCTREGLASAARSLVIDGLPLLWTVSMKARARAVKLRASLWIT